MTPFWPAPKRGSASTRSWRRSSRVFPPRKASPVRCARWSSTPRTTRIGASLCYEPESSTALGFGFRCGFLGLLHMDIIQERLEREFNLELLTSAPGVRYRVTKTDGEVIEIENPQKMPDPAYIRSIEEPFLEVTILTTDEFVGPILALAIDRRGQP